MCVLSFKKLGLWWTGPVYGQEWDRSCSWPRRQNGTDMSVHCAQEVAPTLLQEHVHSTPQMYLLDCRALSNILGAAGQSSQKINDPAAVESWTLCLLSCWCLCEILFMSVCVFARARTKGFSLPTGYLLFIKTWLTLNGFWTWLSFLIRELTPLGSNVIVGDKCYCPLIPFIEVDFLMVDFTERCSDKL